MHYGLLVRTSAKTYMTVEFDSVDEAVAFREKLHRHERVRVSMRVGADTVEEVEISLHRQFTQVQPIVRLST